MGLTTTHDAGGPAPVGRVTRVTGPVIEVAGLDDAVRFEFVEAGSRRIPGEIISLEGGRAVAQLYEYTGGLQVGEPVRASGHPLTVVLGPGILGGIHDGLLRPLVDADDFLPVRSLVRPPDRAHDVTPRVEVGHEVGPGTVLAEVHTTTGVPYLVLVPPGVGGRVASVVAAGRHDESDVIARVGDVAVPMAPSWPVRRPRPYAERVHERAPFTTGQRVLDVLAPIASGSSATVVGGFGEGKTMLLEQIAKWGGADVIVYVGCGERGNELADLVDELAGLTDARSGRSLMERTIILANTSNMPVMAREASIHTAVTIAEHYRDMGLHAVIVADSTSRWAEARRELSSRTGAIPAEQGYPADLPVFLAAFYQRAGRVTTLGGRTGSVTIVTSVSPPGGDVTEPVAAHTQRFVQAVWALDRDLAYARHYPAVSWSRSFTRDADAVGVWHAEHDDPEWIVRRRRLLALLDEADRLRNIADLVGVGALPPEDRVTLLAARLAREAVLQQSALSDNDAYCSLAKQAALVQAVLTVHDTTRELTRDGVPASVVEEVDVSPLVRAKDELAPDDAAGVEQVVEDLVARFRDVAT